MPVSKVAVIGAGVSGLTTLRYFIDDPAYDVIAYEQAPTIGGLWRYPEGCETHTKAPQNSPLYSRMYRDLRINSPKEITCFQGYPMPDDAEQFPHNAVFFKYLLDAAEHFGLNRFIKLRHEVLNIKPIPGVSTTFPRWLVTVKNLDEERIIIEEFDIVIICNGHFGKPYVPEIAGIETFQGPVTHSAEYRIPEPYNGKRVLIIGGNISAYDFVCMLKENAEKVIILKKPPSPGYFVKFPNVLEIPSIKAFKPNSIILPDDTEQPIDAIILCTGYQYDFPFLDEDSKLKVTRGRVYPLYRHIINCYYHSMGFIGIPLAIPTLYAASPVQARYYKAFLDEKFPRPTVEEMIRDTDKDYENRLKDGLPPHHAHKLFKRLWAYSEMLGEEGGFEPYEPFVKDMYENNVDSILDYPCDFKDFKYVKINSTESVFFRIFPRD